MIRPPLAVLLLMMAVIPARADSAADRAAILARLEGWTAAFDARDAKGACDLFAPDLISTVPGALDAGRDAVCGRLARLLARSDVHLRYSPDIREIIVSGDMAVVRLFWHLRAERNGRTETSTEAGMDVFKRQPDGRWLIARFIAFAAQPEQNK